MCSYLYQIAHLGDDDDEPEFSSSMPLEEGDTFFFAPRMLKNLVMVDEMDSLSPIMHCQVYMITLSWSLMRWTACLLSCTARYMIDYSELLLLGRIDASYC